MTSILRYELGQILVPRWLEGVLDVRLPTSRWFQESWLGRALWMDDPLTNWVLEQHLNKVFPLPTEIEAMRAQRGWPTPWEMERRQLLALGLLTPVWLSMFLIRLAPLLLWWAVLATWLVGLPIYALWRLTGL